MAFIKDSSSDYYEPMTSEEFRSFYRNGRREFVNISFLDVELENFDNIESVVFSNCIFESVKFEQQIIRNLRFKNCRFSKTNFNNSQLRVFFQDCICEHLNFKADGNALIIFYDSQIDQMSYAGNLRIIVCKGKVKKLTIKNMSDVSASRFSNCNIERFEFQEGAMCNTQFVYSELHELRLKKINLSGSKFKHCTLNILNFKNIISYDYVEFVKSSFSTTIFTTPFNSPIYQDIPCNGIKLVDNNGGLEFQRYLKTQAYINEFASQHSFSASVWRWTSCYGQSLLLILAWATLFSIGFGFIYHLNITSLNFPESDQACYYLNYELLGPRSEAQEKIFSSVNCRFFWINSYYFSFVTFTTLGYGDITGKTIPIRIIVILESFLGYFLLGMTLGVMVNKFIVRP